MFKSWCVKNNLFTQNPSKATHLFLDGGKIYIPNYLQHEFINVYYKSLQQNERLYVVEKVSETIKLFIDIDGKDIDNFNISILVSQIKNIIPENVSELKCNKTEGYHMIFPNIEISPSEACRFITALRQKLITKYSP